MPVLTRTTHWATQELHAFLRDRAELPFEWGVNDCALFAADAIQAFTGVDLATDFRGHYHDEVGAFQLIGEVTGKGFTLALAVGDAAEWCAKKAGLVELLHVKCAQRGDLLVMEDDGRLIAGIVHLNGREGVSVGAHGLKRLPMESWRRAWKV